MIIITLLTFIASLAALIYSAKLVTDSATHFARVLGASEFIVGATVVALGTSLPELSSSVQAAGSGLTGIVAGNVVGSNIANIALILGLTGIFYVLKTKNSLLKHDVAFFIISAVSVMAAFADYVITATEGILLIFIYVLYIGNTVSAHKKHGRHIKEKLIPKMILMFVAGLIGLVLGARYLISSSEVIMTSLGISESVIGFILIAIGTSLPELSTSFVAAKQGKTDMVLGDIIGSNIFNAQIVFGVAALVRGITAPASFINTSVPVMIILSFLLVFIVYDKKITRLEGSVLFMIYVLALAMIL